MEDVENETADRALPITAALLRRHRMRRDPL